MSEIGTGLIYGDSVTVKISPAPPGAGIVFLTGDDRIEARLGNLFSLGPRVVALRNSNAMVAGVEHLLSALRGSLVSNVYIKLSGQEPPFGHHISAKIFVDMVNRAGVCEQGAVTRAFTVPPRFDFRRGVSSARALKCTKEYAALGMLVLNILIDFPVPIGRQTVSLQIGETSNFASFSSARSFMRSAVDYTWPNGKTSWAQISSDLQGLPRPGSGAIITYWQSGEWLDPPADRNEAARHKAVDLLGDLALLGTPLVGGLRVERPGHQFNANLARALVASQD